MNDEYRWDSWNKLEVSKALVLMGTNAGSEEQVIADAKAIGNVKEAYVCYGTYDLILKIETDTMEDLKKLIAYKYRTIKNVKATLVLLLTAENSAEELATKSHLNYTSIEKIKSS